MKIKKLLRKRERLLEELENTEDKIKVLKENCNHKDKSGKSLMEDIGHNSHKTTFECKACGYETNL